MKNSEFRSRDTEVICIAARCYLDGWKRTTPKQSQAAPPVALSVQREQF
ncbi:MAG: hypothetical protein GY869_12890 [Planctomycetes bacterium]|nr:hypothetical protein [Planctomycetota bacterium]